MMGKREGGIIEGARVGAKILRPTISDPDWVEEEEAEGLKLWLFLEREADCCMDRTFALDIKPGSSPVVQELASHKKHLNCGYAAVGSTIYMISGERNFKNRYVPTTDVYSCDVSDGGLSWQKGPSLISCKPNPLIVTINGKIYALAGCSRRKRSHPSFEVLDCDGEGEAKWEALDDPPRELIHHYDNEGGPLFHSYTVIGNTILVPVSFSRSLGGRSLVFSFDTVSRKWFVHPPSSSSPSYSDSSSDEGSDDGVCGGGPCLSPSVNSLVDGVCGGGPCLSPSVNSLVLENMIGLRWSSRADFIDDKMYTCAFNTWIKGHKVFAYDLATMSMRVPKEESVMVEEDLDLEMEKFDESEPGYYYEQGVLMFPIRGLTHVTDVFFPRFSSGFVTHVANNMFCLVGLYRRQPSKTNIRVCTFEVAPDEEEKFRGRAFCAHNVQWTEHEIDERLWLAVYGWCKVPNQALSY